MRYFIFRKRGFFAKNYPASFAIFTDGLNELKQIDDENREEIDTNSDLWMLGLHLHLDHGLTDPDAFDRNIKFGILDVVNPTEIDKKEFLWMHKLNTFQPTGINIEYPFGIPYLGQK